MITFDELNTQNHEITELCNVLRYLFSDRAICDAETTNGLFFQYIDRVNQHLGIVDHLYPILLKSSDQQANNLAKNFMAGEQEIKKIAASYLKTWTNKKKHELDIGGNHEQFLRDTDTFFDIILKRIQDETEHLYPFVRRTDAGIK